MDSKPAQGVESGQARKKNQKFKIEVVCVFLERGDESETCEQIPF